MRRNRRRLPQRKRLKPTKTRVDLFWIVAIIFLAVFLGFFSTRFVIYPIFFGGDMPTINISNLFGNEQESGEVQETATGAGIENNPSGKGKVDAGAVADTTGASVVGSTGSGMVQAGTGSVAGDAQSSAGGSQAGNTGTTTTAEGYCIQFGSFTTAEGAAELKNSLLGSGIHAEIIEKQGNYKVVGKLFSTKTEAVTQKNQMDLRAYEGVFITKI